MPEKHIHIAVPGHPVVTQARFYVYNPGVDKLVVDQPAHGFVTFAQAKSWILETGNLSLDVCGGEEVA